MSAEAPELVRVSGGTAARRIMLDPSSMLLVAQLLTAVTAFAANILTARALGPTGRGELALLLQIAYFGSLGVLLGCDRSILTVFTGMSPRAITRSSVRLLIWPSAIVVLVAAVVLALPLPRMPAWRLPLAVAVAFMIVTAFSRALRSIAIASGRVRGFLVCAVAWQVALLGGFCVLLALGHSNSTEWMLPYLVSGMCTAGAWLWWWGRAPSRRRTTSPGPEDEDAHDSDTHDSDSRDADQRRRARREGLHLLPATVAHSGTLRLDRLILVGLASTAQLGLYASVGTFTEFLTWPLIVYADSRLGLWRQAFDRRKLSLRRVIVLATAYSLVAGTVVTVGLRLTLVPMLGPSYAEALPLVLPLTLAAVAFGISQILVTALTAVRKGPLSSLVEVIGLGVSVIAYVTLIDRWGALGAAYGSLIGYTTCLVAAALLLIRVRRSAPAASDTPSRGAGTVDWMGP